MYIPQNRIITNLYTSGGEYVSIQTQDDYIGFYYKTSQGKFFKGKTPNEFQTQQEIILKESLTEDQQSTSPLKQIPTTTYNEATEGGFDFGYPQGGVTYNNIKGIESKTLSLPTQYYPTPTENDYKVGNFKRYFCVKTNEDIYLELDKKTYDKLSSKNSNWAHELYTPFQLVWYITGEESQVESTNKNLVLIQEQRSNRKGLKEFLRENYTKFWIP
jgi:hypothetical protein